VGKGGFVGSGSGVSVGNGGFVGSGSGVSVGNGGLVDSRVGVGGLGVSVGGTGVSDGGNGVDVSVGSTEVGVGICDGFGVAVGFGVRVRVGVLVWVGDDVRVGVEVGVAVGDAVDVRVGDDARPGWGVAALVEVFVGARGEPEGASVGFSIRVATVGRGNGVGVSGSLHPFKDTIHALAAATTSAPAPIAAQTRCFEASGLRRGGVTGGGVACGRRSTMVASSWRTAVLGD